ncbi:MAG: hypothetical protein ABFD96_00230 [Armatimonadia bacterium]
MIDPKKQYRTLDGREARVYALDGAGIFCVHGAVKNQKGWCLTTWDSEGVNIPGGSNSDLIEVKPRIQRELWVNEYRYSNGLRHWVAFDSREDAAMGDDDRIACVKLVIDCEEGDGL